MDHPPKKICSRCGYEKLRKHFHTFGRNADGLRSICRQCVSDGRHEPSRHKDYSGVPVERLRWAAYIWYRHRLDLADYDAMVFAQEGRCAICCARPIKAIDHCHETGIVRGLLCYPCNSGLGSFQDNQSWLLSAMSYLRRFDDLCNIALTPQQ